jgi:hypothetical protein
MGNINFATAMLAERLAEFIFRADAQNGPPKQIFNFADLAQKILRSQICKK